MARTDRPNRLRRRWLHRVLALLLAAAATLSLATTIAYPGFTGSLWNELRHASLQEMTEDWDFFYAYFVPFVSKLSPDPETAYWDLQQAARQADRGTDLLEQGQIAYHRGRFTEAIQAIEQDIATHGESEQRLFWLALSFQRRAEATNCLDRLTDHAATTAAGPGHRHQAVCTLPLEATHRQTTDTERSADLFERLLDRYAPDDPLYLWLLNFTHMTLGRYPDGVPSRYLIDNAFTDHFYGERARQTRERFLDLHLRDRAHELGVDILDTGRGVAVEDFDGDGDLDLVTGGTFQTVRYFRNDSGRRFVERTREAGLDGVLQPFIITAADFDGDGWMDLFVARPFHRFMLFRNGGDGTFSDVTVESGLLPAPAAGDDPGYFTYVSVWGDVDRDGDLDLFVAQWGQGVPLGEGVLSRWPTGSRLYENRAGRFVDATAAFGLLPVVGDEAVIGASFGDADGDGWPDLALSSFTRGRSLILRNVPAKNEPGEAGARGRRFEVWRRLESPDPGFTTAFVDVDQDGRLDLFRGSDGPARSAMRNAVFGEEPDRYANTIYLQGDGPSGVAFERRTDLFGGGMPIGSMGASFGDLDNDGCPDFYLGTGNPEGWYLLPNLLYMGERAGVRCTGAMTNAAMLEGLGTVQKGHGIVFFDFDDDGDQDLYSSLGGMWPGDAWPNQLFVNESRLGRSWVKIRLAGRGANRFGVGARIRVTARDGAGTAIVRHATVDSKTGFGSAPYLAHVGLLDAVTIEGIEVRWPASGRVVAYPGELGRTLVLEE